MRSRKAPAALHLFTDGSLISQTSIAAWAGMLIHGCESELRSGLIGATMSSANDAELFSVRYALRAFIRHGRIIRGDTIIIHCDNQSVCAHLRGDVAHVPRKDMFALELMMIRQNAADHGLTLCAEWVRSHQGLDTQDWRCLINGRVDRQARAITKAEQRRLKDERKSADG